MNFDRELNEIVPDCVRELVVVVSDGISENLTKSQLMEGVNFQSLYRME